MSETKQLQEIILSIAKEICNICEVNNIPYFIAWGTQLGAIRHKGFIPWDDDLDIAMKRSDYEKFLKLCVEYLNQEKYLIQTQDTEEYYAFAFCKIQLKGTEIVEEFSKNVPISHGIFVDIFPYDKVPDKVIERKIFLFVSHILKNMLWIKCGYGTENHKRTIQYKILKIFSKRFSISSLKRIQHKWLTRYNDKEMKCSFTCDYPKQQIPNSWINNLVRYPFEDTCFWGIKEYNEYLKLLYGDYMVMPPVDKRVQHSYHKINFGQYQK